MAAANLAGPVAQTGCERFIGTNPEVLSGFTITISGKETAELAVQACNGPVRILTFLASEGGGSKQLIADTTVNGPRIPISLQALAHLPPGSTHVLMWVIDGPNNWQLVSEVILDGTVHYRHLKRNRPGVMNAEMLVVKVRS